MATVAAQPPPPRVRALRRKRRLFWAKRLHLCPECERRLRKP